MNYLIPNITIFRQWCTFQGSGWSGSGSGQLWLQYKNLIINHAKLTLVKKLLIKNESDMTKESEYCSKVIETEFNEPLAMTEKEHEDFHNSSKFCICKTSYEEAELKVKDHNHVTRYYQGSTHQKCNLNVNLSKKSPYCV